MPSHRTQEEVRRWQTFLRGSERAALAVGVASSDTKTEADQPQDQDAIT